MLRRSIFLNSATQNAGIFIGQNSFTGFDSNQKLNIGHGAAYGVLNWMHGSSNFVMDGFESIDAMMNDMDYKVSKNVMLDNLEFIDGVINDMDLKVSPTAEF